MTAVFLQSHNVHAVDMPLAFRHAFQGIQDNMHSSRTSIDTSLSMKSSNNSQGGRAHREGLLATALSTLSAAATLSKSTECTSASRLVRPAASARRPSRPRLPFLSAMRQCSVWCGCSPASRCISAVRVACTSALPSANNNKHYLPAIAVMGKVRLQTSCSVKATTHPTP